MNFSRLEFLSIGDELLDGRVTDTNLVRAAQALGEVGQQIAWRTTVTDDATAIVAAARDCIARGTTLCLVSGGLGPTVDDLTAAALAQLAAVELVRDAAQLAHLEALLRGRGRTVSDNQRRQADRPAGATLVENPVGTAPGFALQVQGCTFLALPGVPKEFDPMLQATVLRRLADRAPVARRALYCIGLMEAEADRRCAPLLPKDTPVRLQFRVKFPEVHVGLHAPPAASAALDAAFAAMRAALQPHVYATHVEGMGFVPHVLRRLRQRQQTLALAESCTGGLLGSLITDEAGCSDVFGLGVIAYAYAAKQSLLGIDAAALAEHGAVSQIIVEQMAQGVRRRAESTFGLAISGIAGPGGGLPNKPVGTVWLAACGPDGTRSRCLHLPFDRAGNKLASAYGALQLLLEGMPA